MSYPRVELDCAKIHFNTQLLIDKLTLKGISVTPVTKSCLGHPIIANTLINAGATMLADSRVNNIKRMRDAGITVPTLLIRSPMLSQIESVVAYCDISLNTEIAVMRKLSEAALRCHRIHQVIIMVELGDLREGVMPGNLVHLVKDVIKLPNIKLKGIGANLTCRYGVEPDDINMQLLSDLAEQIEITFSLKLDIISGGNSGSINWALAYQGQTRINHLRLGEAVFLGLVPKNQPQISGLSSTAITLTAEVIESSQKPSYPWGNRGVNAFGETASLQNRGQVNQAILALGRQDVCVDGLHPPSGMTIASSCSDHLMVETADQILAVGETVTFGLAYSAFLSAMTSEFVDKIYQ
ncbi:alanine/ornithine racemase family PLP-dependent enzyme [Salinivibrio socompensis]|uniref:alanine/ornithine racemase family PLP-dependent enzyme n=1 Tax=Salinivibrio socompensis TaxID=1510206 RepID=UPI000471031E|nr:alanine/ornithine racemase family PLP-dependent enzyme [Salinivibrio socompensis]